MGRPRSPIGHKAIYQDGMISTFRIRLVDFGKPVGAKYELVKQVSDFDTTYYCVVVK